MALTPEQVINKTFQPTKFREGYDQEEVDLFLDEVVAELRRLHKENDELRQEVQELEGSQSTSQGGTSSHAAGSIAALETTDHSSDVAEQGTARNAVVEGTDDSVSSEAAASRAAVAPATESAESAAAVIAMAQRLHDEYVQEGESERARLISEGQVRASALVAEAENKHQEVLETLQFSKASLESEVDSLRTFETSYRSALRRHLESKITELDHTPSLEPQHGSSDVRGTDRSN